MPRQAAGNDGLLALYSAALVAGLLLSAPWWITRMLTTDRYREGLSERLGRVPQRLRNAVQGRQVVWVHAVSVGEVLAASRLVKELGEALNETLDESPDGSPDESLNESPNETLAESPNETLAESPDKRPDESLGRRWCLAVSTTTRSAQALARERFGPGRVFYFPLDLGWAVRAYLRALRPSLLVLMESELWPRMLHECRRAGVPVAVVNARVSDRSFRRALRVRRLWARLLGQATLWLAQSEADAERLRALGAEAAAVQVSGNLKYDIHTPRGSRVADWIREVAGDRPILVAGSTTDDPKGVQGDGEELAVLRAWEGQVRAECSALLVLAPRHPERFGLVESVLKEFAYAKASDWLAGERGLPPQEQSLGDPAATQDGLAPGQGPNNFVPGHKGRLDIILLDTLGDLAAVYAVADLAFVGGSLVGRGGHNPLEPAQFGVPVLMGPSFENFREIVTKLRDAGALCVIEELDGLASAMLSLLSDSPRARAIGERGRRIFLREGGATARTVRALIPLVTPPGKPPGRPSGV